jgi:hypothetical protein
MKVGRLVIVATLLALSVGLAVLAAQAPPAPKPGPEHQLFKMDEGTWDATVEIVPGPGAPPMTSKGVEINTVGCGGLCLVTDFKGEMMGMPFHGHGVSSWDVVKKKYVGTWTDSMSGGLAVGESTWDPATKRLTGTMEGPDATGTITKLRAVVEYSGGTRVFTAYAPGPEGTEMQVMRITYKRRT